MLNLKNITKPQRVKKGFTIIEVMLVLAITGLMLIGLLSSTYNSISAQRYNDSVRNFAEYMRSAYNEALAPQSITDNDATPIGNSETQAILGKMLVFGIDGHEDKVYSATLVGTSDIHSKPASSFLEEFKNPDTKVALYCGETTMSYSRPTSIQSYTLLWGATLAEATGVPELPNRAEYPTKFKGTMIIARTPTSAILHTIFAQNITYDISDPDNCAGINSSNQLYEDLNNDRFTITQAVGICVVSDNSKAHREVRIAADGRNTSAVWIRKADEENPACRES